MLAMLSALYVSLAVLFFMYDQWRYPQCPRCGHNSCTKARSFFSHQAECSAHGTFDVEPMQHALPR